MQQEERNREPHRQMESKLMYSCTHTCTNTHACTYTPTHQSKQAEKQSQLYEKRHSNKFTSYIFIDFSWFFLLLSQWLYNRDPANRFLAPPDAASTKDEPPPIVHLLLSIGRWLLQQKPPSSIPRTTSTHHSPSFTMQPGMCWVLHMHGQLQRQRSTHFKPVHEECLLQTFHFIPPLQFLKPHSISPTKVICGNSRLCYVASCVNWFK